MKHKVFLSYAHGDRLFATALKQQLGALLKTGPETIELFDVQKAVSPGDDIRRTINRAMREAGTVVVVSSPESEASQWVNYEAGLADALGKKLLFVGRKGSRKSALTHRFAGARFVEIEEAGFRGFGAKRGR